MCWFNHERMDAVAIFANILQQILGIFKNFSAEKRSMQRDRHVSNLENIAQNENFANNQEGKILNLAIC